MVAEAPQKIILDTRCSAGGGSSRRALAGVKNTESPRFKCPSTHRTLCNTLQYNQCFLLRSRFTQWT